MLKGLFTMFRNDAAGTLHNCRIAYDLRHNQLQKQGQPAMQCHALGLAQMSHNFFGAHGHEAGLLDRAGVNPANQDTYTMQIFPFAYSPAHGREACAHYFAWVRHGLQPEINEQLIRNAVREGLRHIETEGYKEKLKQAITASPGWLLFAPEWADRAAGL